ncbi:MAG: rRNA pseudouridine synthase [Tannerella sp.]|nr:rRNA pseudouridine synthase [Tannerella sp.]
MNVEERTGNQPHPRSNDAENQWGRTNAPIQNQERRTVYRENREGSLQPKVIPRSPTGRRPRIKDSQRVMYNKPPMNRPEDGNFRENMNRPNYSPSTEQRERRPLQSYSPQRPAYPERITNEDEGREKYKPAGNYAPRPNQTNNSGKKPYIKNSGMNPRNTGDYNKNKKYSHQKQLKYKEELTDPNEPIRLNKYLANAGVCSRREADTFIQAGVVKVNNQVITELGTKISRMDTVLFHEQPVKIESKVYVLLNKPKNCVTSTDDPQERLTVMNIVKTACKERIYPVGRLDRNTTGVLLLTNDGNLAAKLTHPSFKKKKIYHVWLDKEVEIEDMEKIATGIELEDGEIHADAISYVNEEAKDQVGIEIHSGRNRVVRRMFEALGYHVTKLDRVYFAGLTKKNLPRGKWRYLNEMEVNALRMGTFE